MYHIRIYNSIAKEGLSLLDENRFAISDENPVGIMLRSQDLHKEVLPEEVLAIARAGAGTNNIPVDTCTESGIVVFNTPGANSNAVKELVFASMIIMARNIAPAATWVQQLTGEGLSAQVEKGKKQFVGTELLGKSIAVIGLGAIGGRIAQNASHLGMKVIGYDPFMKNKPVWMSATHIDIVSDVEEACAKSDYITLHVPYNKTNHHLIGEAILQKIKPNAVLLNFSRGELVDVDALVNALDEKKIAGYATDFIADHLVGRDDVLLLPHLGASTKEAEINCAIMAAESMRDFLLYGDIKNSVNFANVHLDLNSKYRLSIINRNIANMVALIATALGERNINIDNILNRSRGEYAYTIVDFGEVSADVLTDVKTYLDEQPGIVRARLIENPNL